MSYVFEFSYQPLDRVYTCPRLLKTIVYKPKHSKVNTLCLPAGVHFRYKKSSQTHRNTLKSETPRQAPKRNMNTTVCILT